MSDMSLDLKAPSFAKVIGKFVYYNSRYDSKVKPVSDIVGNKSVIHEFEKILTYADSMSEIESPSIIFQVSLTAKTTKEDPKPVKYVNAKKWGSNYPDGYDGIGWHTVHGNVELLCQLVSRSFITRLGVKHGGNGLDCFVGSQGIQLDLDADPTIDYVATLDILLANQITPNIIHYSPSGNPDNNKLRAIILFDSLITDYQKLTLYIKAVNSLLPNAADQVHDPARLFYGTLLEVPYSYLESVNSFDSTYNHLDSIGKIVEDTPTLESSKHKDKTILETNVDSTLTLFETANKAVVNYINTKILNNGQSIFDLIPQWCEHHGLTLDNWHQHGSPGSNIEQWRGLDPIDPDNSTTGSSFTVYHADDGTYGYNSGRSGVSGDMPDLWFRLSNQSWNVNADFKDKASWWNAVKEICEYHNVPDFTVLYERQNLSNKFVKDLSSCIDQEKFYKGKVVLVPQKCLKLFLELFQDKFLYDSNDDTYWVYRDLSHRWNKIGSKSIKSFFRTFLESFGDSVYGIPIEDLINPSFINGLSSCLTMLPEKFLLKEQFTIDYNHIPCLNGLYNVNTHELLPYTSKVRNTIVLPYTYTPSQGHGIEAIRKFLEFVSLDNRCVDDVTKWIAATVQLKGYYTKKILGLVGDPGSGKSDLTNLVRSLMVSNHDDFYHSLSRTINANNLLDVGQRFVTGQLKNAALLVLEEFNGLPKNSDGSILKQMVANTEKDGAVVMEESKNVRMMGTFKLRTAIITNGQDFPRLTANDQGWMRRFLIMKYTKKPHTLDSTKIYEDLKDFSIRQDFFNWCLEQNGAEIISHFESIDKILASCFSGNQKDTNDYWYYTVLTEMNSANNKYWRFAKDCLLYAQGSSVSSKTLYTKYQEWCNSEHEHYPGSRTSFGLGIGNAISQLYSIPQHELKKKDSSGNIVYNHIQIDPNS